MSKQSSLGVGFVTACVAVVWGLSVCASCASPSEQGESSGNQEPTTADPDDAPDTYEEFFEAFQAARCKHDDDCGETTECWMYALADYGVDPAKLQYDQKHAAQCLAAVHNAACGDFRKIEVQNCADVVHGKGQEGDPCAIPLDCQANHYCENSGQCPGICLPLAQLGEPCPYSQCEARAYCDSGICVPRAQEGEDCSTGVCEDWLLCEDDKCAVPGSRKRPQLGESCTVGDGCDDQGYCDEESGICEPRHEKGEDCVSSTCISWHYCSESNVCEPRVELGEACTSNAQCLTGMCFDGKCRGLGTVGDACRHLLECITYHCGQSGKCLPFLGCE